VQHISAILQLLTDKMIAHISRLRVAVEFGSVRERECHLAFDPESCWIQVNLPKLWKETSFVQLPFSIAGLAGIV
jgi:hypothetical protein